MAVPYDVLKRSIDIAVSSVVLVITLPLQAVIGIAIALKLGRPVLFRQPRPGKHGKSFELVKFRTMKLPDPQRGIISDEDRMTPLGHKLRSTSLDELPTLWNVLRGDMSLVGPRPLLMSYLDRYSTFQARRHEVRPGVTGLAQVNGRNAVNWDDRFRLDVEYVDRRSLLLDLRILVQTVSAVLRRDGIAADGHVTMPEFQRRGDVRE
jgi:lipopolysaccharide/colanic/teichoic acid biosynthesis glycosyltransferase